MSPYRDIASVFLCKLNDGLASLGKFDLVLRSETSYDLDVVAPEPDVSECLPQVDLLLTNAMLTAVGYAQSRFCLRFKISYEGSCQLGSLNCDEG